MACERFSGGLGRGELDAFVDGELSADAQREFDAHLRACPSCAADIANRVQLKSAVKRAGRRFAASADFRRKIENQALPRKRTWSATWIPAVAAAAVILFAAAWMLGRLTNGPQTAMLGELIDAHIATLASANPVDVVSTDQHTVKPWFEGKLPFAVNVPDLKDAPFTLIGGRVTYLEQEPGAGLLFQYRKHRLSAFIFQDRPEWKNVSTTGAPVRHTSFWVETWSAGGLRYFVMGDTSAANVEQLSDLMKRASAQ
ncbi:MAG TPA: zf-HC2 domain-containing protein [Candidatus Acidoferrales bacterium]|nr:zf-HC2 domain-containing protein [Candidatus Acidoferrales bacterium]